MTFHFAQQRGAALISSIVCYCPRRHEEDHRRVAEAQADGQRQLAGLMEKWKHAILIGHFCAEAEARLEKLDENRRGSLQERWALIRSIVGTVDPLDFFLGEWFASEERYETKYPEEWSFVGASGVYGIGRQVDHHAAAWKSPC